MGWNRPSDSEQDSQAKSRRRGGAKNAAAVRLVVALVFVAAICAAVVWWLLDGGRETQPTEDDVVTGKPDVTHGAGKTEKQKPTGTQPKKPPVQISTAKDAARPEDGDSQQEEQTQAPATNAAIQAQLEKFKKEPVKGLAEQLIMMVIPPKKGELVPPPPIGIETSPELESEAQAMLERQGVVEDWDDDNSIEIKERLELLKDEWYAFKKEGGTFHEFLQKRLQQSNFDTQTLEEARKFDSDSYQDQTLSDEEYDQLHGKVNKLLEIQGFDKIERPDAEPEIEEEKE